MTRYTTPILYSLLIIMAMGTVARSANSDGEVTLSPLVVRLLDDPLTSAAQGRELRLFHGQWDELESLTISQRGALALGQYRLAAGELDDPQVDPLIRAQAALKRGEPEMVQDILRSADSFEAALLRARAREQFGQHAEAIALLGPMRARLSKQRVDDPAELVAAAVGLVVLARLEGRPAEDWQLALNMLGRAGREIDPLYWPARVAEADLLIEKDNRPEAAAALTEALALNPQCGEAWYRLGLLEAESFDFVQASRAIYKLRAINPDHLLADLLETRSLLIQRDVDGALAIVESALRRNPNHRHLLALLAATKAMAYDENGMTAALDRFDQLAPRSPQALHTVGVYLSLARQYPQAKGVLTKAINRQPNSATSRIELGLLLMQWGDLSEARRQLAVAKRLDPFHRRGANSLRLVEQLLEYDVIQTEHFTIRYKPGIDQVLARDFEAQLESIYRDITTVFEHRPSRKTQIDLLPDEKYLGVRITGLPEIWTIAASTGDVIALTPPRPGAKQRGSYNWANVVRHEFVHTVTLSLTGNRLPHWFTEACAVSQEQVRRTYDTCQLLSWALQHDELFAYEQVNWGFVRPRTPRDRPLAYAQADWMIEFIANRFGHSAILALLDRYRSGTPDSAALHDVTGLQPDEFMDQFKLWATKQVAQWGLDQREGSDRLDAILSGSTQEADDVELAQLLAQHPNHPDLLRLIAQRALDDLDSQAGRAAVLRYAAVRPVDPWPHRILAQMALAAGRHDEAIALLEQLDRQEANVGDYSFELAKLHRAQSRLEAAGGAIKRALQREPYNATYRELAATIALQRGRMEQALVHLLAMATLEPKQSVHQLRLAALYQKMNRDEDAASAAQRARALNPDAPVERFIKAAQSPRGGAR